jgi:hypothetical protein
MRERNWKLLYEHNWNDARLFDLSADPSRTKNIANDHAAVVYRLTQEVVALHKSMPQDNEATSKEKRRK